MVQIKPISSEVLIATTKLTSTVSVLQAFKYLEMPIPLLLWLGHGKIKTRRPCPHCVSLSLHSVSSFHVKWETCPFSNIGRLSWLSRHVQQPPTVPHLVWSSYHCFCGSRMGLRQDATLVQLSWNLFSSCSCGPREMKFLCLWATLMDDVILTGLPNPPPPVKYINRVSYSLKEKAAN